MINGGPVLHKIEIGILGYFFKYAVNRRKTKGLSLCQGVFPARLFTLTLILKAGIDDTILQCHGCTVCVLAGAGVVALEGMKWTCTGVAEREGIM